MPIIVPPELVRHVTGAFKQAGRDWLDRLPELLAHCAERWALTIEQPLPGLSYGYVAPALCADGRAIVLKLSAPQDELRSEIAALHGFGGEGAVKLLDADAGLGIMLLERLRPGTPLLAMAGDVAATEIAAGILQRLWRPAPADPALPDLARWVSGLARLRRLYGGGSGPLPAPLVDRAEGLFADLLAAPVAPLLLHGDLHYGNILAAERAPWLAIDPKGVSGEATYDAAVALLNLPEGALAAGEVRRIFDRRADQLAGILRLDRPRLLSWALAHAVLSAWWTIEDDAGDWRPGLARAAVIEELL